MGSSPCSVPKAASGCSDTESVLAMDIRGRMIAFGTFGVVLNGVLYFLGVWMPVLLFAGVGLLFVALVCMSSDDSTNI